MSRNGSFGAALAVASAAALALPLALFFFRFDSASGAMRSVDFTDGLFEDFLGPYWRTAESIAARDAQPDPQYLYPPALAVLLSLVVPAGPLGASITAAVAGALSVVALCAAGLLMRPNARGHRPSAALGALVGLSFPVVHGAAWGNASLWVIAAAALGWALALRERHAPGGGLVGLACAIKPTPLLVLVGLVALSKRRATVWACASLAVCGALFPAAALGLGGAMEFTREAFDNLARLRSTLIDAGGPGSQDIASSLQRLTDGGLPRRAALLLAGVALAGLALLGRRALRTAGAKRASLAVPLLAFPTLLVLPSWPHAHAWIPLALWCAWPATGGALRRVLCAASAFAASLPAAWLFASPAGYIGSGLLPLAAVLALLALLLPSPPLAPTHPATGRNEAGAGRT